MPAGVTNVGAKWTGAAGSDFHAGVASAGFGGGLKVPYQRGQAVPCTACHASHGSSNLYHVPGTVNGSSGVSVTNGPSAENLCRACHSGTVTDWHNGCGGPGTCHYTMAHGTDHGADPGTPTSGSNCLGCHGHGKSWRHNYVDPSGCDCHGDGGVNDVFVPATL
jgi:hypothetical protein